MKLILSRKGFDSANGGCPSPIIDGHLCSLPIPDAGAPTSYKKISPFNGAPIAKIVEDLTRGQVRRGHRAHLDPDLRRDSIARAARMASDASGRRAPRRVISRGTRWTVAICFFSSDAFGALSKLAAHSTSSAARRSFTSSSDGCKSAGWRARPMIWPLKFRGLDGIRISSRPIDTRTTRSISRAAVFRRLARLASMSPAAGPLNGSRRNSFSPRSIRTLDAQHGGCRDGSSRAGALPSPITRKRRAGRNARPRCACSRSAAGRNSCSMSITIPKRADGCERSFAPPLASDSTLRCIPTTPRLPARALAPCWRRTADRRSVRARSARSCPP